MVVRPWSVAVYTNPKDVRYKPDFKLPTANFASAWLRETKSGASYIEVMTLDLQFLYLMLPRGENHAPGREGNLMAG